MFESEARPPGWRFYLLDTGIVLAVKYMFDKVFKGY